MQANYANAEYYVLTAAFGHVPNNISRRTLRHI